MNWFLNLFRLTPKPTRYTIFWATKVDCTYTLELGDGTEFTAGSVVITPHAETYEAFSIEQAKAMHRSDNPGTEITSIMYLSQ